MRKHAQWFAITVLLASGCNADESDGDAGSDDDAEVSAQDTGPDIDPPDATDDATRDAETDGPSDAMSDAANDPSVDVPDESQDSAEDSSAEDTGDGCADPDSIAIRTALGDTGTGSTIWRNCNDGPVAVLTLEVADENQFELGIDAPVEVAAGSELVIPVSFTPLLHRNAETTITLAIATGVMEVQVLGEVDPPTCPLAGCDLPGVQIDMYTAQIWRDVRQEEDLDLHFLHPNGTWEDRHWDSHFRNRNANWGDAAREEDNAFYYDVRETGEQVLEYISLAEPEDGITYRVGVHYYDDGGAEFIDAGVLFWIDGELVYSDTERFDERLQFWEVLSFDGGASEPTVIDSFRPSIDLP